MKNEDFEENKKNIIEITSEMILSDASMKSSKEKPKAKGNDLNLKRKNA